MLRFLYYLSLLLLLSSFESDEELDESELSSDVFYRLRLRRRSCFLARRALSC